MSNWKNEAEAREQIKALVADYYHDFKEKNPGVDVIFQQGDYADIMNWLRNGDVDMAFTTDELAKDTNNPDLLWKVMTKQKQQRDKKHRHNLHYGEQGWDKSTNTKNNINLTNITKNKELKQYLKR